MSREHYCQICKKNILKMTEKEFVEHQKHKMKMMNKTHDKGDQTMVTEIYCRLDCLKKRTGSTICGEPKVCISKNGECLERLTAEDEQKNIEEKE